MEDQNDEEGYTVDKELLINAWCKFRPMGEEEGKNSSTGDETKRMMDSQRSIKKKTQLTDVNKIFGDLLVFDILRNFHLKLYNFSETDAEQTQRQQYKHDFRDYYAEQFDELQKSTKAGIKKQVKKAIGSKATPQQIEDGIDE